MSNLYLGRIYVDSIEDGRIVKDKHGRRYAKIAVIMLEEKDQFGNDILIQHRGTKLENNHIVIGNAQFQSPINYVPRDTVSSKIDRLTEVFEEGYDDLP